MSKRKENIIKRTKDKRLKTNFNDYINRNYQQKSQKPKDEIKYMTRTYNEKKDAYETKLKKYSINKLWENEAELIKNEIFERKLIK